MSQMPPPPASQPTPMPGSSSTVGGNKKLYTILAYVLTWIGGIIFLFVGKDDPDVKWNAANSLVIFGGLTILNIVLGFIPGLNLITFWLILLIVFGFWLYFLVMAIQGNGEKISAPGIGGFLNRYVDQVANMVK